MSGRGLRPVAFLLAMLGFGLRLDTTWHRTATTLVVAAAALAVLSLRPNPPPPFVPGDDRR